MADNAFSCGILTQMRASDTTVRTRSVRTYILQDRLVCGESGFIVCK